MVTIKKMLSMFLGALIGLAIFYFGIGYIVLFLKSYLNSSIFDLIFFVIEVFLLFLGLIIGAVFFTKPIEHLAERIFKKPSEQSNTILRNITQEPEKNKNLLISLVASTFIGTFFGLLIASIIVLFLWNTSIGISILRSVTPPSDYEGYAGLMFLIFLGGGCFFVGFVIAWAFSYKFFKSKFTKSLFEKLAVFCC